MDIGRRDVGAIYKQHPTGEGTVAVELDRNVRAISAAKQTIFECFAAEVDMTQMSGSVTTTPFPVQRARSLRRKPFVSEAHVESRLSSRA